MGGLFDRLQEDMEQRDKMAGMSPADLLMMPDDERRIVQALARRGDLTVAELCEILERDEADVRRTLADLHDQGFAREMEIKGRTVWRTYFGRRKPSAAMSGIWASLAEKTEEPEGDEASGSDREGAGDAGEAETGEGKRDD
jgi:predicted ArsR family transcriptional regulator